MCISGMNIRNACDSVRHEFNIIMKIIHQCGGESCTHWWISYAGSPFSSITYFKIKVLKYRY